MNRKIILSSNSNGLEELERFFYTNKVLFDKVDFWDNTLSLPIIPESYTNTNNILYIVDYRLLNEFLDTDLGLESLTNFTVNNLLWVTDYMDAANFYSRTISKQKQQLLSLNLKNVTFFIDAELTNEPNDLNLNVRKIPYNVHFKHFPNIVPPNIEKNHPSKDFMLTMIVREKQHRKFLQEKLKKNTDLTKNSTIVIHEKEYNNESYVGNTTHIHDCQEGHAAMDLYSNHYFELVAETRYNKVHHFSEKTAKPIATCTPFIVLGTPCYLQWLTSIGFNTFSEYFDESYDTILDLNNRIDAIIDTLYYIQKIGYEKIYKKAQPVLKHNFYHLQNLSGQYHFANENFYYNQCLEAGIIFQ